MCNIFIIITRGTSLYTQLPTGIPFQALEKKWKGDKECSK